MAEPIDLPFGLWTLVGRKKHKFSRIRQVVGATWRIQLNRPSVAAMRGLMSNYFDHLLLLHLLILKKIILLEV